MALVNEHYLKLQKNYLFADIAKKVNAYKVANPKARVISLGIGDVTRPLVPAVIDAMHKAVDDMAHKETFHGYGPEQGYLWLREAIVKNDFLPRGIRLDPSEVFVNDGAKSDTGNIGELVRWDNSLGVTDPIYPVYIDSNVMCGRAGVLENGKWSNVTYMPCMETNDFVPQIPDHRVDMIYLCYPNNPTGTVITKEELKKWVNYALKNDTLILYDAAYEAYITEPHIPHSIYEIKGARKVAIEFHSYYSEAELLQCVVHQSGVAHIIVNHRLGLFLSLQGVYRFGSPLADIACAVELGALSAEPERVQGDALLAVDGHGGEFLRYHGVSAAHSGEAGRL